MKFNRLIICMMVIARYMVKLQSAEKNPAYMCPDLPGIVFMQYTEKGETYFTIVSETDYKKIKTEYWLGTNNYVSTCRDGKTVYLHREEWSESRLVFPNTRGNMVHNRNLQHSLYRIFAKAGLRERPCTRCVTLTLQDVLRPGWTLKQSVSSWDTQMSRPLIIFTSTFWRIRKRRRLTSWKVSTDY